MQIFFKTTCANIACVILAIPIAWVLQILCSGGGQLTLQNFMSGGSFGESIFHYVDIFVFGIWSKPENWSVGGVMNLNLAIPVMLAGGLVYYFFVSRFLQKKILKPEVFTSQKTGLLGTIEYSGDLSHGEIKRAVLWSKISSLVFLEMVLLYQIIAIVWWPRYYSLNFIAAYSILLIIFGVCIIGIGAIFWYIQGIMDSD